MSHKTPMFRRFCRNVLERNSRNGRYAERSDHPTGISTDTVQIRHTAMQR